MSSEEEMYKCQTCDHTFVLNAPDPEHTKPTKNKEEAEDPIPVDLFCEACGEETTIYWGISVPE